MSPALHDGAAVVAVHDVSPATWRECRELFAMLEHCGVRCASLLVIPDYHHRAPAPRDAQFLRALEARMGTGDELVLHGFFHLDESDPPRSVRAFVERRLLTRSEGEFAALSEEDASRRISAGIAMFDSLGWPLAGFVPPAWLMSAGTRDAIDACGHRFSYASVKNGLYLLPEWRFIGTANLCYSATSAARRAYSRLAIAMEQRHADIDTLLRITLHPQDAREPAVLRHWARVIAAVAATRRLTTKRDWVAAFRPPVARAASNPPAGRREAGPAASRASSARPAIS